MTVQPAHTVLIAVLLLVGACERRAPTVTLEEVRAENAPDQESWEPDLYLSEKGRPRLRMRAAYMAYFERPDSTYMMLTGLEDGTRVRADIYDAAGDSSAKVLADRILYYDRDRRLEARGDVVVTTREGRRLESEHLEWSEFDRSIRTPGFARIDMPDRKLQGYGLEADEELIDVRLRNVTGIVLIADDQ